MSGLRVPFVDVALHRRLLAGNFEPARTMSKAILFRQTARELPEALWQRQKTGFYIPVAEWLREEGYPSSPSRLEREVEQ